MVAVRNHPNTYVDIVVLQMRPLQLYFQSGSADEYRATDRILFGTDYPFTTVFETIAALRRADDAERGARLSPVREAVVEGIVERDVLAVPGFR